MVSPRLSADDLADTPAGEHLNYFNTYLMTLLRGYADYLSAAEEKSRRIDLLADRVGYTELYFYANAEEMNTLQSEINAALLKLANNETGVGRRQQKIAFITHPVDKKGSDK